MHQHSKLMLLHKLKSQILISSIVYFVELRIFYYFCYIKFNWSIKIHFKMSIQIKKLELIEWIAQMSDANIISKMDKLRKTYLTLTKEKAKPMSLEEFYASIEKAEKDIKSGKIYSLQEAEKESENW